MIEVGGGGGMHVQGVQFKLCLTLKGTTILKQTDENELLI